METHDDLHDDDKPVGRVLTRRELIALFGGAGAALAAGLSVPRLVAAQNPTATPLPACVVRPELTEGPYFVDNLLNRVDIRIDPADESIRPGLPLLLIYRVSEVTGGTCTPLEGAQVDVWHCDADGVYSGVRDRFADTTDAMWLRGYQLTDADGIARFITIVPGWYPGRAVHIHFKVRTEAGYDFTSQLFFNADEIADVYEEAPYAAKGLPDVPNERDGIFRQSGDALTVALVPLTDDQLEEFDLDAGLSATFDLGLDLSEA